MQLRRFFPFVTGGLLLFIQSRHNSGVRKPGKTGVFDLKPRSYPKGDKGNCVWIINNIFFCYLKAIHSTKAHSRLFLRAQLQLCLVLSRTGEHEECLPCVCSQKKICVGEMKWSVLLLPKFGHFDITSPICNAFFLGDQSHKKFRARDLRCDQMGGGGGGHPQSYICSYGVELK